jgi:mono/diheme cytochrome c family protein
MRLSRLLVAAFLFAGLRVHAAPPGSEKPSREASEFFEQKVRPVLVEKCFSCHGPKKQQGGLRLDSRPAFQSGGDNGPVVIAGKPDQSVLVKAVRREGELKMPPKEKLAADQVEVLTEWVRMGAPWSDDTSGKVATATVAEMRQRHWAFRPVNKPDVPAVRQPDLVKTPVDAFVLSKLEEKHLSPSAPTGRRTLIRRVTFDLTGLPPTPQEVEAFVNDSAPDAYARVVDRLLASPSYGERWGRHWLDVARYSDTKGYVFTEERRYPNSYTYRDYVIRAFNDDKPYDRFLVEQIAADRLPAGEDNRALAALGFLTLGRRFLNNQQDIVDDRIDVTMRGLQGLTVACARCHDHKFDPIPTRDYYSLYGVFASSQEPAELPLLGKPAMTPELADFEAELAKRSAVVDEYAEKHKDELKSGNVKFKLELTKLHNKVAEWKVNGPGAPPRAMVLNDLPKPVQPHVLKRGNPGNPAEAVPRQFLEVLAGPERKPFTEGSGRLELARAIASRDNPLTARVMVNRVWMHHFGKGLVRTPGDFGTRGEPPTHPELLDWLAWSFMDGGWSVKQLQRIIVLSSTYQQASDDNPHGQSVDPENRLLWKMNRQRLDFEEMRDSLLSVAGRLDRTMGGRAVPITEAPFSTRRTVYGFIDRQNLPGLFRTFDFASPDVSTPQRFTTTVPPQALYLMNSPFVSEQARRLANRLDVAWQSTDEKRIDRMYQLAYGRPAEQEEIELGLNFLATANQGKAKLSAREQYAQVLVLANEFAFVD